MSFLMKSADDMAANRMTLGAIGADLYDLAALASAVGVPLRTFDCQTEAQELALIQVQRLVRLVAEGVERAALALGHLQLDVAAAPLTALRAGEVQP
jgi:hypothetical protein